MMEFNPSPEFEEKVRQALAVPEANPEFINKLHAELADRPVRTKSHFVWKPVWAFVLAILLLGLVASTPAVVNALKKVLGYVPEVGLVENPGNLRILAQPVSVTREGVTLTVTSAYVYPDHVEVIYDVKGIDPANDGGQPQNATENPKLFCGGLEPGDSPTKEGNAILRLPDGTVLERDLTGKYPQNVFAMKPVYEAAVPASVSEMTLVLDCVPWARRGAVPEHWEVPLHLVTVPEGTVVGAPVLEVEPTAVLPITQPAAETPAVRSPGSSIPASVVTMTLEKVVPMANTTVFYFSMNMEDADPSLVSIMPVDAYLIDAQGQTIDLIGDFTWQPFEHRVGSAFQFTSQTKPTDGPLTLVVQKAVAYYAPLYVDPQQATPDEMSFVFDAGENPQYGQTWQINKDFMIAGYPIHVLSVRAANWKDIETPNFLNGSQGYEYGYEFTVETDPSVKMLMWMDIMSESPSCWLSNAQAIVPDSSSIRLTQLCTDAYPKGNVRVTIGELSVLVDNTWQTVWQP